MKNKTTRSTDIEFKRYHDGEDHDDDRRIELSFSSEAPYERSYGTEILGHDAGEVELGRLNNRGAFLLDHDPTQVIGVVERSWIDSERRGRAVVRFGKGQLAEEIYRDLLDGIRTQVSVGYTVNNMQEEARGVFRATDWRPFEISIVGVAADETVGYGRGELCEFNLNDVEVLAMANEETRSEEIVTEEVEANVEAVEEVTEEITEDEVDVEAIRAEAIATESKRVSEILELGNKFEADELAQKSIKDGDTVDAVRSKILNTFEVKNKPMKLADTQLDLTKNEVKNYSLMKAIRAHVSGDWKDAGFEREVNIALADKMGKDARGFYVPTQAFTRNSLTTTKPNQAEDLVGVDHMSDMFIDVLRPNSVVMNLGATVIDGLVGNVDIPKQTAAAQMSWIGEGEDVIESNLSTGTVSMTPKTISGASAMSRRLLLQSAPSIENMVINDLLAGIALAIDKAALMGTGTNGEPLGIVGRNGVGAVQLAGNGVITRENIVDLETQVNIANALNGSLGFAFNAKTKGDLKKSRTDAGSGEFLMTGEDLMGYNVGCSNQMLDDTLIFGNFSDLLIGFWSGIDLVPDEYALASSGGLVIRSMADLDINVRRAESFAVGTTA